LRSSAATRLARTIFGAASSREFPLSEPAEQTQRAEAGGEERECGGSGTAPTGVNENKLAVVDSKTSLQKGPALLTVKDGCLLPVQSTNRGWTKWPQNTTFTEKARQ